MFEAHDAGRLGSTEDLSRKLCSGLRLDLVDGMPVLPPAEKKTYRILKRCLDILVSLLSLIALAPLLAIIAVVILSTSPGAVFFRQSRVGLQGREFTIFKFRTMFIQSCDAEGAVQATEDDARVTRFGRFLRRSSLDELPQLLNVLRGEMSFVGPRPMVRGQLAAGRPYRELVPYYDYRLLVKPGLTGWAQCNGFRGATIDPITAQMRIDHDCAYIQNRSMELDIKVVIRTILLLLK